jgi:hypothetical protein
MATTSLYISYAYMRCTPELVRKTFSTILGDDFIETIRQKVKKYDHGKPHRTFQICFKENTPGLQEIIDRIYLENFIQVAYEMSWDWLLQKYEKRYWKVYIYAPKKPIFKAHIMEKVSKLSPVSFVNETDSLFCKRRLYTGSDSEWDELQASLDKFDQITMDTVRFQTSPRTEIKEKETETETEEDMHKRLDEARRMEYHDQNQFHPDESNLYSTLNVD